MSKLFGEEVNQAPYRLAMGQMMADLQYPVAPDGTVLGISDALNWLKPAICYHFARCGYGLLNPPLIKAQPSENAIIEDAVTWVAADAPDNPLADLTNMTMGQINSLPEPTRTTALRRLGLLPPPEPDPGWVQPPVVDIQDAPESAGE